MGKKHLPPEPPKITNTINRITTNKEYKITKNKFKIKINNFMNKYVYSLRDKYLPRINNYLIKIQIITKILIDYLLWALTLMMGLRLLGYQITIMNYISSFALVLILDKIKRFIYKLNKIDF